MFLCCLSMAILLAAVVVQFSPAPTLRDREFSLLEIINRRQAVETPGETPLDKKTTAVALPPTGRSTPSQLLSVSCSCIVALVSLCLCLPPSHTFQPAAMTHIKTDGPQPESRPLHASAAASTTQPNTTAPVPEIDWGSDWRETNLFTFLPPAETKSLPLAGSTKTEAPSAGSVLPQTQKLPTNFTCFFPGPQEEVESSSSRSSEPDISSETAGPGRETDKAVEPVPTPPTTITDLMKKQTMDRRRQLLSHADKDVGGLDEIKTAPIFTETARIQAERQASSSGGPDQTFSQYGLLAGNASDNGSDELFYYNVAAPSSIFICGSQGSGKSHTLSCLLENSLFPSVANELPRPLTGIVFHCKHSFSHVFPSILLWHIPRCTTSNSESGD